jgi:DNA-binding NtrC family response regulator
LLAHGQDPDLSHPRYPALATIAIPRFLTIASILPPLRERREEIEPLARHFVRLACRQARRPELDLSPEALAMLEGYEWPGNVRELRNVMERAVVLCSGGTLRVEHLPGDKMFGRVIAADRPPSASLRSAIEVAVRAGADDDDSTITVPPSPPTAPTLEGASDDPERLRVLDALARFGHNQTKAARFLGISRQTLSVRMDRYQLPRPRRPGER